MKIYSSGNFCGGKFGKNGIFGVYLQRIGRVGVRDGRKLQIATANGSDSWIRDESGGYEM